MSKSENEHTFQHITLDDERAAVVFTEDGRVFYDLDQLVSTLTHSVLEKTILLVTSGDATSDERSYMLGQTDMAKGIMGQRDGLRAQHEAQRALAGVDSLADIPDFGLPE